MLVSTFWLISITSYRIVSLSIVHTVAKKIIIIQILYICFPSLQDLPWTGERFSCLIMLPAEHAHWYLNQKLFHLVQLQAVSDEQGNLQNIIYGYPWSVKDSCELSQNFIQLLSSQGLQPACSWWLSLPYQSHISDLILWTITESCTAAVHDHQSSLLSKLSVCYIELPVSHKSVRAFPVTSVSGAVGVIFTIEVNKQKIYSKKSRQQIVSYNIV